MRRDDFCQIWLLAADTKNVQMQVHIQVHTVTSIQCNYTFTKVILTHFTLNLQKQELCINFYMVVVLVLLNTFFY